LIQIFQKKLRAVYYNSAYVAIGKCRGNWIVYTG